MGKVRSGSKVRSWVSYVSMARAVLGVVHVDHKQSGGCLALNLVIRAKWWAGNDD